MSNGYFFNSGYSRRRSDELQRYLDEQNNRDYENASEYQLEQWSKEDSTMA